MSHKYWIGPGAAFDDAGGSSGPVEFSVAQQSSVNPPHSSAFKKNFDVHVPPTRDINHHSFLTTQVQWVQKCKWRQEVQFLVNNLEFFSSLQLQATAVDTIYYLFFIY